MQLICRYEGVDYPAVVGHVEDAVLVNLNHPSLKGCVVVPFAGETIEDAVKTYGKAGPEPTLMGEPPTERHPDHAELDAHDVPDHVVGNDGKPKLDNAGVPVPHPLRAVAGKPYPDHRRVAEDLRQPAAPPQSDAGVLRSYLAQERWRREVAGIRVMLTLGEGKAARDVSVQVATDRESQQLLEVQAARAARRPDVAVRFKDASDVVHYLDVDAFVRIADAVADHVAHLRNAEERVRGLIGNGDVASLADITRELEA